MKHVDIVPHFGPLKICATVQSSSIQAAISQPPMAEALTSTSWSGRTATSHGSEASLHCPNFNPIYPTGWVLRRNA